MVLKKRKRAAEAGSGGLLGVAAKTARRRAGGSAGLAAAAEKHAERSRRVVGRRSAALAAAEDANVDSEDEAASSEDGGAAAPAADDEEELFETPDEKRVRVAKEYLGRLSVEKPDNKQDIQEQLNRDVEDHAKRSRMQVEDIVLGEQRIHKQGHRFAVTCVCLSSDDSTAYTGGKDCTVVRWDVETGQKAVFPGSRNRFECGGHFEKVLSVCLVEPRSLLASAGADRLVRLWDHRAPHRSPCKETLQGHTDAVTGIVAEADGTQLYTSSMDKSLKLWDLRTKRCVDTLFGHVSGIGCMDMYNKGRPVTGGMDKTVRLWKVDKETHLMFNRHSYAVDAVTVADQDRFLSGSQDGNLHLWSHASKKPLATASLGPGSWISALQAVRRSNIVFGGTVDGKLRCWRFARGSGGGGGTSAEQLQQQGDSFKGLRLTEVMPPVAVPGCINAIAVGRKVLACAVGKEHRLGRWYYDRTQKNGLLLMPLSHHEG